MAGLSPELSPDELKSLFIHQLNRINCAKGYLIRNLPVLMEIACSRPLQLAIGEDLADVKKQLARVEEIYVKFNLNPSDEGCEVLKAVIEEAYKLGEHTGKTAIVNDMDIILYMQLIEHIEMTTYRMLKLLAGCLKDAEVEQMILECFHETIDNDKLFVMISEEYLSHKK